MSAAIIECKEAGLRAIDRCDRCGNQAYVEATLPTGTLLFCARDARENWDMILGVALVIADHRPFLDAQEEGLRTRTSVKH